MQFNNVKLLETDIDRTYFTRHGLHFNSSGKEFIALKLATVVKSFSQTKRLSPIFLKWKVDSVPGNQDDCKNTTDSGLNNRLTPRLNGPMITSPKVDNSILKISDSEQTLLYSDKKSNRSKKAPLTRSDDFLWF